MKRVSVRRVFFGFIGNFAIALGSMLWLGSLLRDSCSACTVSQRALIGITATTCIVFARPALTDARGMSGRVPFATEPVVNAILIGRLMGLALGVMTCLWLGVRLR